MAMATFVDTSALLALLAPDDSFAPRAERLWRSFVPSDQSLVSTNYVWVEAFSLLQKRCGMAAARAFQQEIAPLIHWIWVDREAHDAAVEKVFQIDRRGVSLVDCTCFEMMRREGIKQVFAFDPHFAEFGFEPLSADAPTG